MLQFVIGFALGAWLTAWYQKSKGNQHLDQRMAEIQIRLNTLAGEARRVVEEVRKGVEDRMPGEEHPSEEDQPVEQSEKAQSGPAASS